MTDYKPPKMYGNKVAVGTRFTPDQHRLAVEAAARVGLSLAEYLGALVERDAGLPNKIDDRRGIEELPITKTA
ncbi:hypothetical protein [Kocuria flava]|uniref:hypothetical protein n=1 Tax=Kocuria flava TaxID=446860 RepID=UPI000C7B6845|nr:hypothetical protein [Kocuria flava]